MSKTYLQAQTDVYQRLGSNISEAASNQLYPLDQIKQWLNDAQKEELNSRAYPFMEDIVSFNTSIDTTLSSALTAGDVTVDVTSASVLLSSGSIVINENIIAYTGISTNTLTGVTGVDADHDSSDDIRQIYSLSTDLSITTHKKPISLSIDGKGKDYYNYRGIIDKTGYTVYDGYLYIPENSEVRNAVYKYKKSVTTLTDDSDTFEIPDDYATFPVEFALYKAFLKTGDSRAADHFAEFERITKKMAKDYGVQTEEKKKRIRSVYERGYYRNTVKSNYQ